MGNNWKILGSELNDPDVAKGLENSLNGLIIGEKDYDSVLKGLKYPEFLQKTTAEKAGTYDNQPNPGHEKNDKGHLGDPLFKNLFPEGKQIEKFDLSPNFGTEIEGVQLSELNDAAKNDLALFLETRGLAVFRKQDFRDKGPGFATEFGKYFGPLHIHPVSYSAQGYPEIFTTIRKGGDGSRYDAVFQRKSKDIAWHSDISFEEYPASFSFFVALEAPPSGGDTVFIDLREAYRRLSPSFQKYLETLTVVHSNLYQRKAAEIRGQLLKIKDVSTHEHPLVRTHPVTGEKSLYFSRGFIQKIKGLKSEESDAILSFLEDHVTNNPELQVRASHRGTESGTVIAWDNRFLLHTATSDFLQYATGPRHHFRLTVLGEKPYLAEENKQNESENERPRAY
ncbi:hypothetical protein PUMCH_002932 [Australozyma saopauloensis]|uniref:TauD/TfdA-like domain-containing protein n=1 Tax=Australozyma saopauloensis TaxID=291208 RepID=A0AAX4HBC3_9ASCO|nr:hypothetical protein PUMCH_002932 [[Candida] saopauloensis]